MLRSAQEQVFESEGEVSEIVSSIPSVSTSKEIESLAIDTFSSFRYFHASGPAAHRGEREESAAKPSRRHGVMESPYERFLRLKLELGELQEDLRGMETAREHDKQSFWALLQEETKRLSSQSDELAVRYAAQLQSPQTVAADAAGAHSLVLQDIQKRLAESAVALSFAPSVSGGGANKTNEKALLALEQRVHRLETMLGVHSNALANRLATDPSANETMGVYPLVQVVQKLEQKLALIDAGTLDALKSKFVALKNEIASSTDPATTKSSSAVGQENLTKTLDAVKKLDGLIESMQKLDSVVDELPIILTRLKTLEGVHWNASMFANRLQQMEKEIQSITQEVESNQDVLHEIKEGLKENLAAMELSMQKVESRLASANL